MVYFAIKEINGIPTVIQHTDLAAMLEWDGVQPEMALTRAEFLANDNLARVIKGKIFRGYTKQEKLEQARQKQIEACKHRLENIDKDSGAGRTFRKTAVDMGDMLSIIRKAAMDMGVMLGAVRKVAMDFGDVTRVLGEINPELAAQFNPDNNEALQLITAYDPDENLALKMIETFDPADNEDLQRIIEYEEDAKIIREQIRALSEPGFEEEETSSESELELEPNGESEPESEEPESEPQEETNE